MVSPLFEKSSQVSVEEDMRFGIEISDGHVSVIVIGIDTETGPYQITGTLAQIGAQNAHGQVLSGDHAHEAFRFIDVFQKCVRQGGRVHPGTKMVGNVARGAPCNF